MNEDIVKNIRVFNRFYVREIGLLQSTVLNTGYTLTEAHILNEIKNSTNTTATSINLILQLDEGYLSRVIKKLVSLSLIEKRQSLEDKRKYYLSLTSKGVSEHKKLDILSSELVEKSICHLSKDEQLKLQGHMDFIMNMLGKVKAN